MLSGYSTYFSTILPLFSNPVTWTFIISPMLRLLSLKFLMLSSSLMRPDTPRFKLQNTIRFWIFLMNAKMYVSTFRVLTSAMFLLINPYPIHLRVSESILWYNFVKHWYILPLSHTLSMMSLLNTSICLIFSYTCGKYCTSCAAYSTIDGVNGRYSQNCGFSYIRSLISSFFVLYYPRYSSSRWFRPMLILR